MAWIVRESSRRSLRRSRDVKNVKHALCEKPISPGVNAGQICLGFDCNKGHSEATNVDGAASSQGTGETREGAKRTAIRSS